MVEFIGCKCVLDWYDQREVEESLFQDVLPGFLSINEDDDKMQEKWCKHPEDGEERPGDMDFRCNTDVELALEQVGTELISLTIFQAH